MSFYVRCILGYVGCFLTVGWLEFRSCMIFVVLIFLLRLRFCFCFVYSVDLFGYLYCFDSIVRFVLLQTG